VEKHPVIGRTWSRTWPIVSGLISAFVDHPVSMLAKQAAYSLLYALPAIIALLVSLTSLVDRYTDTSLAETLQREIDEHVPEELQPLLDSLVQHAVAEQSGTTAAVSAVIALGIALWGGASGTGALVYACNLVFDVFDTRSYIARKLLTLVLTLGGGAMVIAAFVLVLLGERIGAWIAEKTGWSSSLIDFLVSSRLPPALLLFVAVASLYWFAPDVPRSRRWVLPGTILVTLFTMLAFVAFDVLVRLVNPGSAFGAAGSVLVLLWLLYLVSVFVVGGAIINAVLSDHYDERMIAYLQRHPERRRPPQLWRPPAKATHRFGHMERWRGSK
jgi:membrane protein